MDTLTPAQRSERMARVRSKDTKPEWTVRRIVHALGFRYRLHGAELPGRPDMVFASRRKVIFVHGCFWHRHGTRCALTRLPKSKLEFWQPKLEKNRRRDRKNVRLLRADGWDVLVLWECELQREELLADRVVEFLEVA
jgi:DNA mismatch endonuclease (patch repair protein)